MATTLDITKLSPNRALFVFKATDNTAITFKKSGATGADKDLSALQAGPLKTYLSRIPNWSVLLDTGPNPKISWRVLAGADANSLPVNGGVVALTPYMTQSATAAVSFISPVAGSSELRIELSFVHSLAR